MPIPKINDTSQRKLALDPTKSFIVQAPAGSGKTTLLVERYLTLLSHVNNPEEIVAITFTRKAAYEMRLRIIEKLKNLDYSQYPSLQTKINSWGLMLNPNRLRIQTIDAFCYYLISQTPIFTKINPNFKILQNQEIEIYYQKAAKTILENLSDPQYSKPLESLLLHLDNDWEQLSNLFITMLKSREQWLPHIVGLKTIEELRHKMEIALKETIEENLESSLNLFPQELHQELALLIKISQNDLKDPPPILQHINYEQGFFKKDFTTWQNVANILLTKEYTWRKKVTKDQGFPAAKSKNHKLLKAQMESLLIKFAQHENLRLSLENLLLSPPPHYNDQQWEIIDALLELLPLLAAHLKVIFNENNVTDHTENSMAALQVLGNQDAPSDLALNLDYRLQHLLIDEFQDTSLFHYRLIEKLITTWQPNDGRTIFVVGDPMQSIYKFREAEVGLFLRVAQNGMGDLKLHPVTLTTNFRSAKNIIDWINLHFAKILPTLADISLGAVPFNLSTAINHDPHAMVKINLIKDGNVELEACQVIATIKNIIKQDPNDTIAILVKARKHLQKIIPALREAKLDYQAYKLETLSESMAVCDLLSLTRALFDLADRIAWLAILRAPWCGLTLEDLYKISRGENELVWDNICAYPTLNLSIDGAARLRKFHATFLPILEQRARIPWRELVEKAWLMLGGPATVINKIELEHALEYLALLEDPLDISTLQKKLDSSYTAPTAIAKIQIMTIHKAKGLEFDHVIIPGINRTTRFDERKLLLWFERPKLHRGSNLILAPIAKSKNKVDLIYQYLRSVESKKEFYETGRLLYVAMTRAKKSIHVVGIINNTLPTNSLLEQLKPCFNDNWIKDHNLLAMKSLDQAAGQPIVIDADDTDDTTITKIDQHLKRLACDWQSPIAIDLPQGFNRPLFAFTDNQATIVGTVIHQVLRQLSENILELVEKHQIEHYINKQNPCWRKLLQFAGILNLEQGLKLVSEAVRATLNDDRGRWILNKHQSAASELAITTSINGRFENYIIDRTFIDEDGTRWIIDYKTTKPNSVNLENFLEQEIIKHEKQLMQYAAAMHVLDPAKTIKTGLYFPLFGGWISR